MLIMRIVLIINMGIQVGRMKYMAYLADIVIIAILATAVLFILRGQIRKHRKGQCCCGCSGCSDNCCSGQNGSVNTEKK